MIGTMTSSPPALGVQHQLSKKQAAIQAIWLDAYVAGCPATKIPFTAVGVR